MSLAGIACASYIGENATDWSTSSAVTATASSQYQPGTNFSASRLTNGGAFAGLEGGKGGTDGEHHTPLSFDAWISKSQAYGAGAGNPVGLEAASANNLGGVKQWVQFAFDKTYSITNIMVWNGAMNYYPSYRSAREVRIDYSTDGTNWTKLGDYTFQRVSPDTGFGYFHPHSEDIAMNADAKYVVFSCYTNYAVPYLGWPTEASAQAAEMMISEVRFNTVPEPMTIALLGLGGFALLRRKLTR